MPRFGRRVLINWPVFKAQFLLEQNMLSDSHAHGAADKFMESYFHADDFAKNPFQIMKHQTVSVQVQSILNCYYGKH